MWQQTHSITAPNVTKEQMWQLFADVNNWHTWDAGIEYAAMQGRFEAGNHFILKPKKGPKVKIQLAETVAPRKFTDLTIFPLAKMYGEHTFEDTPSGLKITTTMKVEGPLTKLWVKLVAKEIADALPVEMAAQVAFAKNL